MGAAIARLDDVAMDEVHLTTPVSDEAIRSLKLGDVVYLSGALYTAREGVYRQVVDKGVAFPDAVRALTNVNFHCSPAAATRPDGTHVSLAPPMPTPTIAGWQARPRLPDSIRVSTKKRLMPATPSPGNSMR